LHPPPTSQLYTPPLHDALPISTMPGGEIANMIDKPISAFIFLGIFSLINNRINAHISASILTAIGTIVRIDALICALIRLLMSRSEEHTSELQSRFDIVCRLLL